MKITTRQLRRIIRERLEAGLSDRDLQHAREDEELGSGRDEWEDVSDRDLQYAREDEDPAARAWQDGDPFEAGYYDGKLGRKWSLNKPGYPWNLVDELAKKLGVPPEELEQEYGAGYESGAGSR